MTGGAPVRQARTERGEETRRALLKSAEEMFAERGYHDASIVKITERAGVAQGTFYIYFAGKREIFDEVVADLNHRVRHAMVQASARGGSRFEAERLGFAAFFAFTAEHPALYQVIRQAEIVSPGALRKHYERIASGYVEALQQAMDAGEVVTADPVVTAWALMGIGEMIGMRWVLWGEDGRLPEQVYEDVMALIGRALGAAGKAPEQPDVGR